MFIFRNILGPSKKDRLLEVAETSLTTPDRHSVFDTTQSTSGSPKHQPHRSKVTETSSRQSASSHDHLLCGFAKKGKAKGQLCRPGGVAVTLGGDIVVADTDNCRIQVFDHQGHLKKVISEKGSLCHQVNQPMDVCVIHKDDQECIVVTDSVNSCLKLFSLDGSYLDTFRSTKTDLEYPYGVCSSVDDKIVATDLLHHSVIVFDFDGHQLSKFGQFGDGPNEFDHPYYITVNNDNHIVVSSYGNMSIKVLTFGGEFLCQFTMKDFHIYQDDFVLLQSLTTDGEGNVLVIGNSTVYVVANNGRFWEAILPFDILENPKGLCFSPLGYLVLTQEAKNQEDQVFIFRYPIENFRSLRAVPKPYAVKRKKSPVLKYDKPAPLKTKSIESKAIIVHGKPKQSNILKEVACKESKCVKFSEKIDEYKFQNKEEHDKPVKREKRSSREKTSRGEKSTKYKKKVIYSDLGGEFILGRQSQSLDYELIEQKRRLKAKSEDRSRVSPAHIFNFN